MHFQLIQRHDGIVAGHALNGCAQVENAGIRQSGGNFSTYPTHTCCFMNNNAATGYGFREAVLHRKQKIVDDDLPRIADAYKEFRTENPEPGR